MGCIAARRKHNAPERRRQLADAAIELLGGNGVHGVSHPKVDEHAGVPAGTTSFYFRTRKALLHAVATRLNELDVADLSLMAELAGDQTTQFTGTAGLARIVMYVNTEPWLTRAKARYELRCSPAATRNWRQPSTGPRRASTRSPAKSSPNGIPPIARRIRNWLKIRRSPPWRSSTG